MDWKIELVAIPVTDVDRAKARRLETSSSDVASRPARSTFSRGARS
jgi:hypothetical protein